MSYAFRLAPNGDRWVFAKGPGELDRRYIKRNGILELYDVSIVTYPAFPASSCGLLYEDRAGDRPGAELISDERTQDCFRRLAALDARAAERKKNEERQRGYERMGKLIAKNNAWISEKKRQGAMPISHARQEECLARYYQAGETIQRLNREIAAARKKENVWN